MVRDPVPALTWTLDARLGAASHPVADLTLCHVRLQDDARWPWLVLVPRRPGLVELEDLAPPERALLAEEVVLAGAAVRAAGRAVGVAVDKLNVGALGNVVAQLHVHVVGRRRTDDPAAAHPVWGRDGATRYDPARLAAAVEGARAALVRPPPP